MRFSPPEDLAGFVLRLPKTETHLHFEGALPLELLRRVAPETLPADGSAPAWWDAEHRFATFAEFEEHLVGHAVRWYTSPERYHEAGRLVFAGLVAQNVRYVETSFHLPMSVMMGVPADAIVDAILSAAPPGLEVRVFAGMQRRDETPGVAAAIERVHRVRGLSGIDFHGVETWPLPAWGAEVWARARAAGMETKAHAGEFGGAEAVRQAVEVLGVRRVQHGVRSTEDPEVLALLARLGVTCDVTPISNVKLKVVPSLAAHPIRRMREAGVRVTVSTDDPFSFGNRLLDEYAGLAVEAGMSRAELRSVARAGFEVALVDAPTRARWLDEVDAVT